MNNTTEDLNRRIILERLIVMGEILYLLDKEPVDKVKEYLSKTIKEDRHEVNRQR